MKKIPGASFVFAPRKRPRTSSSPLIRDPLLLSLSVQRTPESRHNFCYGVGLFLVLVFDLVISRAGPGLRS
jgi:hypothetical protein